MKTFWLVPSALLCLVCAASHAAAQVGPQGIPAFHRVSDAVYRGGQPTPEGLEALRALGIKRVLDLRENGEGSRREADILERFGIEYQHVPMREIGAPSNREMRTALSMLEDAGHHPIFVHCRRGKDRTGTVVACYRIEHDRWSTDQALIEAEQFGLSRWEQGMRNFIRHFSAVAPDRPFALLQ